MAIQQHVKRNCGHPWSCDGGAWDLLEVRADSEGELITFIERAEHKFWQVWIRDRNGIHQGAVLYKPHGASSRWADDGKGGFRSI